MRRKNGFTLIELLAVIVILAIIALIATPIILGVIEKARIGAAQSSAYGYIDAVEKQIAINMLDSDETNNIVDDTYTVKQLTDKGVTVKGHQPTGTVTIKDGQVTDYKLVIDEKYTITPNGLGKSNEINTNDNNISLVDENGNNEADIGEIIKVVSTENTIEEFYVISNDGTNIKALAKYNLYVGGEVDVNDVIEVDGFGKMFDYYSEVRLYDNPTGLQRSDMIGEYRPKDTETIGIFKGVTAFLNEEDHDNITDRIYNDYSKSTIKKYVDAYGEKLPNIGKNNAMLITYEELVNLGCTDLLNNENATEEDFYNACKVKNREWIYETSYWTSSGAPIDTVNALVWIVDNGGVFFCVEVGGGDSFGVRPVIVISKDKI